MPQEGAFEAALSATEIQAAATLQSAAALTRELKRVKAGATAGQTRELRRALETAEALATQLAEAARSLRAGYDFDEPPHLASGAYAKELLAGAAAAGVAIFEEDDWLMCYPSLVRVFAARQRSRWSKPRAADPAVGAGRPAGPRTQEHRGSSRRRSWTLRGAYELVVAGAGKRPDAVVRLVDVWAVLTLLPGQGREYSKQEFARDLYLLDQSGWPPPRAAAGSCAGRRAPGRRAREC